MIRQMIKMTAAAEDRRRNAAPTRFVSTVTARTSSASEWGIGGTTTTSFASRVGTALWAGNVRRPIRAVLAAADLDPADWTPRELRHSFVSPMSDAGVPIEKIARLVRPPERRRSTASRSVPWS